jgi:hypothetical protein
MRKLFFLAMLAGAVMAIGSHGQAIAQCNDGGQTMATASQQPQWFNGQWWYRTADRGWLVWSGKNWVARADNTVPTQRVFSYQPGTYYAPSYYSPFNPATVGNPTSDVIIGSYGLRAADSKALGDYR